MKEKNFTTEEVDFDRVLTNAILIDGFKKWFYSANAGEPYADEELVRAFCSAIGEEGDRGFFGSLFRAYLAGYNAALDLSMKIATAEPEAKKTPLKAARERTGMTLEEAAVATGVSLEALKQYEAGTRVPRDGVKVNLACTYDCTVAVLFPEKDEPVRINLAQARKNAGITQASAAEALSVSRQTIASWESGKRFPSVEQFTELCKLYQVPEDFIAF